MEVAPAWSYSLCRIHFTLIPGEENLLTHADDRAVTATRISSSNQEWLLESEAALEVWGPSEENDLSTPLPAPSSGWRLLQCCRASTSTSSQATVTFPQHIQISLSLSSTDLSINKQQNDYFCG